MAISERKNKNGNSFKHVDMGRIMNSRGEGTVKHKALTKR